MSQVQQLTLPCEWHASLQLRRHCHIHLFQRLLIVRAISKTGLFNSFVLIIKQQSSALTVSRIGSLNSFYNILVTTPTNDLSSQMVITESLISYPSTIKLVRMIHAGKIPRVN